MRKKLQTLREGAGYTQQTFSERLGVSRSHYAPIELSLIPISEPTRPY